MYVHIYIGYLKSEPLKEESYPITLSAGTVGPLKEEAVCNPVSITLVSCISQSILIMIHVGV